MADTPRLVSPRLQITLDDGAVLEVQTRNPDQIRWERTRAQHKWPAATDAPITWLTFLGWAALRREAQIPPDLTWETFAESRAVGVQNLTDDDPEDDDDPSRPTPPGPGPG